MKEEVSPPGAWTKDSEAVVCKICSKEFNIARRKHHCRYENVWFLTILSSAAYESLVPCILNLIPSILFNKKFVTEIVAASFATVAATTKCNFPAPRSQCVSVTTATHCWSTSNLKCSRFCQAALDHSRLLVQSTYFQHNCPAFQSLCSLF